MILATFYVPFFKTGDRNHLFWRKKGGLYALLIAGMSLIFSVHPNACIKCNIFWEE